MRSMKSSEEYAASAEYAAGASTGPARGPSYDSTRGSRGLTKTTYRLPSAAPGRKRATDSGSSIPVRYQKSESCRYGYRTSFDIVRDGAARRIAIEFGG